MVGLSDIPCVGIVVDRISEAIVDIVFRGSSYLFCTKNLVKDLNSKIEKVEVLENEFATKVTQATNDGKIIKSHVMNWQENVKSIKTEATEISGQTTSSTCCRWLKFPNPAARFRRGKRAAHLATTVTEETNSGREYLDMEIADLQPTENLPHPDTTYQIFGSRQEAYKKLWDSIVNEDGNPILGIYGMPGAGKTRMMEQLWQEAMEKGIFKKVTRANVGQTIDVLKLQNQLAHHLSCNLKSKDFKEARGSQLQNSLKNGGKTLVILDDVWDVIPLSVIGIPFADGTFKGCKILLTSRRRDMCSRNGCVDPIEIKVLTPTEAWEMFQNTVGTSAFESFKDTLLAKKVCEKCGALPLLIHVVGSALKCGTENIWKTALYQLNNQKSEEIEGMEQHVYACVQLSFLKLAKDARICLLLCSVLFPEDADIKIKEMSDIATTSGLLEPDSEIAGLVDTLKFSSLLLQGKDDDTVKLHDIIRDVGRSVAVKDPKYAFLFVRCKARWPDTADYSTGRLLHVDLQEDNARFPNDDLVCQHLCILWLQCNNRIQNGLSSFVKRFTNLKVVVLQSTTVTEEQFSVSTFDKLRMLSLDDCRIDQVFLNSVSKTLETLCISDCSLPVPLDIAKFKDLIKLELVMWKPTVVTGISKLTRLEELNVPSGFATSEDDSTGISDELSTCNCLRKLTINFPDQSGLCPSNILDNLDEFRIDVGSGFGYFIRRTSHRRAIRLVNTNMESGWMALLERAEDVQLEKVKGLPINGFSDSCNSMSREAFANLRELYIWQCDEMQHIARWDGRNQQQLKCFTNLRKLFLNGCRGLKYVFSSRVANCLQQLQTLQIYGGKEIEEIVKVDDGQEIISFPNLTALYLLDLPELTGLYNNKIEFPRLKELEVRNCDKLEIVIGCTELHGFSNLEQVKVRNCNSLKTVFHHSSPANQNAVFSALRELTLETLPHLESFLSYGNGFLEIDDSKSYKLNSLTSPCNNNNKIEFPRLKNFEVRDCHKLEIVIGCTELHGFQNLEQVIVRNCNSLKTVFQQSSPANQNAVFPALRQLTLEMLPHLESFLSYGNEFLEIDDSKSYTLLSSSFQQILSLKVSDCNLLKEIVEDAHGFNQKSPISLPKLKEVMLSNLPDLQNCGISACYMPELSFVEVDKCAISSLFTCSAFRNLHKLKYLEVRNCHLLEQISVDDMNDNTPGPSENMISLPCLEIIELEHLHGLRSFSSNNNKIEFPQLKKLQVWDCHKLEIVIGCTELHGFQNLEQVSVRDCNSLKTVFQLSNYVEDAHGFNQKSPISLPKLRTVTLSNLPNLQNSGVSACYMPELWSVQVDKCAISSLFTCSAFRNLHKLETLGVRNCHLLEQISVDDTNDETPGPSENMISLPLLRVIELEHLHGLKSFSSSSTFTFTMPALRYIELNDCPCMDKFTFLQMTTPLLNEDLNDFVRLGRGKGKTNYVGDRSFSSSRKYADDLSSRKYPFDRASLRKIFSPYDDRGRLQAVMTQSPKFLNNRN